jgi:hypothetical protein
MVRFVGADSDMVVSATPSDNTVRFYFSRGFQPMAKQLAVVANREVTSTTPAESATRSPC